MPKDCIAEEEFRRARIANRPAAGGVRQLKQRPPLSDRNDVLGYLRFGFEIVVVGVLQGSVAADRGPRHPQHLRGRTGLARTARGRRWILGAARQAKPMDLADDGIAGHRTEFARDLAGRQPVGPELFQQLHPLIGPTHESLPVIREGPVRPPAESAHPRPGAMSQAPHANEGCQTLETVRRTRCRT